MTIPHEGPFEWRNGRVLWRCGRCGEYTVKAVSNVNFYGERYRAALCLSEHCMNGGSLAKFVGEWQGIEQEARNLMYA